VVQKLGLVTPWYKNSGWSGAAWGHFNVLIPTLTRGGAERIVVDSLSHLRHGYSATLILTDKMNPSFPEPRTDEDSIETLRLAGIRSEEKVKLIGSRVLASGNPAMFVHLAGEPLLRGLWERGVRTIPVVHNTSEGWLIPATVYNNPQVPFVVAVCEAVAQDLRRYGCMKRIVSLRHEVSKVFSKEEWLDLRHRVRNKHGIDDATILIGMVGQFKEQKNYPQAVRILEALQKYVPAQLLIVGGWNHSWGKGRAAFTEMYRVAVEIGVVADVIVVGSIADATEYYPAFDVLLNTSSYEGLSIALLEGVRAGCRIVSSDVGGAREIGGTLAGILPSTANVEAYASRILNALRIVPTLPETMECPDLVASLWGMLGEYGDARFYRSPMPQKLFLTESLSSELMEIIRKLPVGLAENRRIAIGVVGEIDADCDADLRSSGTYIYRLPTKGDFVDQTSGILRFIKAFGSAEVYFVGLSMKIRLLLAKILPPESVRLFDFLPECVLVEELRNCASFQERICFDESAYYRRLTPLPTVWCNG
jgi:glycosyltransferase involved in cell wall biosynthesis